LSLPNFLLVGANRAGTTAMHGVLSQHPEIFMSRLKEPSFFAFYGEEPDPDRLDIVFFRNRLAITLEAYQALFTEVSGHKAIGEASTAYLNHPAVPARIKSHLPDARVLAILRDPVDRAFSNYAFHRSLGIDRTRTFSEALGSAPHWRDAKGGGFGERYVALGFYASAVRRYYEAFGREQVRIYLYEDWTTRPREVLTDIFRFLEVSDAFVPDVSLRVNESSVPMRGLAGILNRRWPPGGRGLGSRALGRLLRRWNRRRVHLLPADRQALVEVYRQDVLELQDLLGRNLSTWLRG
jgi:hypothetical protein